MDNILNIILQNPYRVLGVYTNSSKKDIVANKGRATAFLKVNRPVEYPLDLKGILPQFTRTLDSMNEAEAHLAIAKELVKYAQFWYIKITPIDDIAFNHLLAGNMESAKEIWSKQESVSSLQNKIVCYLIENKPWLAIKTAEKLYDKYGDCFISKIDSNSTLKMSSKDLLHMFIDTLGEEVGMQKLLSYEMDVDTKAYISSQAVGPIISKISSEVENTKKTDHKDPNARINAARRLVTNTRESFSQLKSLLPSSDPQFQMIADKLGLEILQCGIDYFNNSEEDDAPYTAMKMQKYAQSIVVGTLAKQRCEENVRTLQKIIYELPPKEVITEDRAIKAELSKYVRLPDKISYAVTLLNNTKPHLQMIKNRLGVTNSYYLKVSTQIIGNAMHNVVEEVNAVQNDPQIAVRLQLGLGLDPTSLAKLKEALREAWKATIIMDGFDMEPDYKSHYNENRNTLKSMCDQLGVSTYVSRPSTSSRPSTRPTTSTTSIRSSTSSRPSTAYSSSSSSSSSSSDENYGCIIWSIVAFIVGAIGATMTQSVTGFIVGVLIVGGIWGKIQG